MNVAKVVEDLAVDLLRLAVVELPFDVKEALQRAFQEEESEVAKMQLKAILDNVELAEKERTPICQDTGLIAFYVRAGACAKGLDLMEGALYNATRRATKEVPLRPNAVNPLTRVNSGDNTGWLTPYIHWEIALGDVVEITAFPKGAGSDNMCVLSVLTPAEGMKGLKRFVIDAVMRAGAQPCPPNILGVGIGGGPDVAMKIAKEALLRPLNQANPDAELAKLEKELYEAVNMTGIGPMGLGGKFTVLGVNVKCAFTHTGSLPVAVAFQCWAARRATAKLYPDGSIEYITHKVVR